MFTNLLEYLTSHADLFITGILESLIMTLVSAGAAYLIGLPLGILLIITDNPLDTESGSLKKKICKAIYTILGFVVNVFRSIPFIILMIFLIPVTRFIVGTTIGSTAAIVPLVVAAAPFVARMVESSIKEVDDGVVEAARSMGASTPQIIWKVLLPEARPSLLIGSAITVAAIFGYAAMAGFIGGGGLGAIAINYGFYRYQTDIMMITLILSVILVQILQVIGMRLAKVSDKRIR